MKLLFSKSLKICVSIDSIGLLVSSVSIYFYCYVCFSSFQLYRKHVALGYQKFTLKNKQIWKIVCYFISKNHELHEMVFIPLKKFFCDTHSHFSCKKISKMNVVGLVEWNSTKQLYSRPKAFKHFISYQ